MPAFPGLSTLRTSRLSASEEPGHARCMEGRLDASGDMRSQLCGAADIVTIIRCTGRPRRWLSRSVAVLNELLRWRPGLFHCKQHPDEEDRVPVSGFSVRRILQSGGFSTWHELWTYFVSSACFHTSKHFMKNI